MPSFEEGGGRFFENKVKIKRIFQKRTYIFWMREELFLLKGISQLAIFPRVILLSCIIFIKNKKTRMDSYMFCIRMKTFGV